MKFIKNILAIWGAISAIIMLMVFSYFFFSQFSFNLGGDGNKASTSDVSFVLNWAKLGDERIQSVLHSFESTRSLTGDHVDAFEIKTTGISEKELQDKELWTRGDQLSRPLKDGVEFIKIMVNSKELPWFPSNELLTSDQIYIFSWSISYHHKQVTSAKIIFVKPSEGIVYYFSART